MSVRRALIALSLAVSPMALSPVPTVCDPEWRTIHHAHICDVARPSRFLHRATASLVPMELRVVRCATP